MGVGWTRSALVGAMLAVASCTDASSTRDGGGDAAVIDEGRLPSGDDGAEGCVLDGYTCGDTGECCSGACVAGLCGEGGTCLAAGSGCTTADECCSRACVQGGCADTPPDAPDDAG